MNVSPTVWAITLGAIALIFVVDILVMGRLPSQSSPASPR